MGGRGAWFRSPGLGELLSKRWHTVAKLGDVTVIAHNDTSKMPSCPACSGKPFDIYATFADNRKLTQITYYGSDRLMKRQVDFGKPHRGYSPHVHFYEKGIRQEYFEIDLSPEDIKNRDKLLKWKSRTTKQVK